MKVLVIGGSAFNGYALVKELVRSGHDVTVLNRGITEADLPRSVQRLVCDRTDHATLREVLRGREYDCVQDMSAYHPEDVTSVVECLRGNVGHYIFVSSTVIYGAARVLPITEDHPVDRSENQIEYGLHKLLCEDYLIREHRERGLPATIVPFSMVLGPRNLLADREQRMFVRLLQGRPALIPGSGTALGQICHVDDQARALRMMMTNPVTFGKRYNLSGREWFSDEGYVDTIAEVMGVEAQKVFVPAPLMDDLWDGRSELGDQRTGFSDVAATMRMSDAAQAQMALFMRRMPLATLTQKLAHHIHRWDASVIFSTERLRRDIGWEADFTFAGAIHDTYEWFRREKVAERLQLDFTFEDELLGYLAAHPPTAKGAEPG